MTKDEALKLALEALELHGKQYPHMVKGYCLDVITAIKEALANEALEKKAENARELGLNYEPERFLVATIGNWGRVEWADGVFPSLGNKLYSAPPKWVGLTDEEEIDALRLATGYAAGLERFTAIAQVIEAKLKEKNL